MYVNSGPLTTALRKYTRTALYIHENITTIVLKVLIFKNNFSTFFLMRKFSDSKI